MVGGDGGRGRRERSEKRVAFAEEDERCDKDDSYDNVARKATDSHLGGQWLQQAVAW